MNPEQVLEEWRADRRTYIRDHVVLAVIGAVATCLLLYWMGNSDWWVGVIAAPAALAVRGFYLASEELVLVWQMTPQEIRGSQGKRVALSEIETVRSLGSSVQLVTRGGDKHLMKYMADPAAVKRAVARAAGVALP